MTVYRQEAHNGDGNWQPTGDYWTGEDAPAITWSEYHRQTRLQDGEWVEDNS